ncbi:MAG: glucose-6-phosphate dehydrogenase assembly protein OpcA [Miltoncostaeaceae bacterium]
MSTATANGGAGLHGEHVEFDEVLSRLAALREDPDGGAPTSLAGVLNLVAVAPRDADPEALDAVIGHLANHHPCRLIVLRHGEDGAGIDAEVSAVCGESGGGASVCVEVVLLTLGGRSAEGAASVVVPLLRPELPNFLWWPGAPVAGDPLLSGLTTLCERVVTETARVSNGAEGVRALAGAIAPQDTALTDLAWATITPWRQLLTTITQPEDIRLMADGPAVVSLAYAGREPSLKALLIAGWLRDSLGDHLMVDLQPRPGNTGRIEGITIEAPRGLSLAAERIGERPAVALRLTRGGRTFPRRVLPLRRPRRIDLLAGELELQRHDRPFERAVSAAARLSPA